MTPPKPILHIADTAADAAKAAATFFAERARKAVESRGVFRAALSGGSTPKRMFEILAGPSYVESLPWEKITLFQVDERLVPPDHERSNFRMLQEALLSKVPPVQAHRMRGEAPVEEAAEEYEALLLREFEAVHGTFPRFDAIFLGIGDDGHTASLFPGSASLFEDKRLVLSVSAPEGLEPRITLTFPVINSAAECIFLAFGEGKADILERIFVQQEDLPAGRIRPQDGELHLIADKAAAARLIS